MADRLEFSPLAVKPRVKTKVWAVLTNGMPLGYIQWYAHWRRYTLFPVSGTLWDAGCLREVAKFCEDRTKVQQHEARVRREAKT